MTDRIQIRDPLLRTIVGINPEERRNGQDVLINIRLHPGKQEAGALRFARSAGVEIDRSLGDIQQATRASITLGSNTDPEQNLPESARLLG